MKLKNHTTRKIIAVNTMETHTQSAIETNATQMRQHPAKMNMDKNTYEWIRNKMKRPQLNVVCAFLVWRFLFRECCSRLLNLRCLKCCNVRPDRYEVCAPFTSLVCVCVLFVWLPFKFSWCARLTFQWNRAHTFKTRITAPDNYDRKQTKNQLF